MMGCTKDSGDQRRKPLTPLQLGEVSLKSGWGLEENVHGSFMLCGSFCMVLCMCVRVSLSL